jgi:hypothetical protein
MSESLKEARARFSQPETDPPEEVAPEPEYGSPAWHVALGKDFISDTVSPHPGQIWQDYQKTKVKVLRIQNDSNGEPHVVVEIQACPTAPHVIGWETSYYAKDFPSGRKLIAVLIDAGDEVKVDPSPTGKGYVISDRTLLSKKAKTILTTALKAEPNDDIKAIQDAAQKLITEAFRIPPVLKGSK